MDFRFERMILSMEGIFVLYVGLAVLTAQFPETRLQHGGQNVSQNFL